MTKSDYPEFPRVLSIKWGRGGKSAWPTVFIPVCICDLLVGQASVSWAPYSYPLPQLRGIPAIPPHPSARNARHAANVGRPRCCRGAHMLPVLVSLDPEQLV